MENHLDVPVCRDCLGSRYLFDMAGHSRMDSDCHFCGKPGIAVAMRAVAIAFDEVFARNFMSGVLDWEEDGKPVREECDDLETIIREQVGCRDNVARGLMYELVDEVHGEIENFFGDIEHYSETNCYTVSRTDRSDLLKKWNEVQDMMLKEARYYNPRLNALSRKLFSCLELANIKRQIIRTPGDLGISTCYRGRIARSKEDVRRFRSDPGKELYAPPPGKSPSGRMNAGGISVLYLASSVEIAIAELRPNVGDTIFTVGFELPPDMKLLCLHDILYPTCSIFDPNYDREFDSTSFLRVLAEHLEKPLDPSSDKSDTSYLSSCYFSEYIHHRLKCDGIVYKSVQAFKGLNVAIFHPHMRVLHPVPHSVKKSVVRAHRYILDGELD